MAYAKRIIQNNLETKHLKMLTVIQQRNNGRTVRVGRFIVDNRYIVPYHAGLLKDTYKYRDMCINQECEVFIQVRLQRVMIVLIWRWL